MHTVSLRTRKFNKRRHQTILLCTGCKSPICINEGAGTISQQSYSSYNDRALHTDLTVVHKMCMTNMTENKRRVDVVIWEFILLTKIEKPPGTKQTVSALQKESTTKLKISVHYITSLY